MPPEHFAADWPAPASVRTLLTTREGGVSAPPYRSFNLGDHVGDDPAAVHANRARLARMLPAAPRWLRQVHGVRVVDAGDDTLWQASPSPHAVNAEDSSAARAVATPKPHAAPAEAVPVADAAITRAANTVCAVLIADCLPVLLCSRDAPVVAVAHAGWRGLSAGVLDAFDAQRDADARPCFAAAPPGSDGAPKWFADLFALARLRLRRLGVVSVHGGGDCTVSQPARFFSHRRDRVSGRQAALIWME